MHAPNSESFTTGIKALEDVILRRFEVLIVKIVIRRGFSIGPRYSIVLLDIVGNVSFAVKEDWLLCILFSSFEWRYVRCIKLLDSLHQLTNVLVFFFSSYLLFIWYLWYPIFFLLDAASLLRWALFNHFAFLFLKEVLQVMFVHRFFSFLLQRFCSFFNIIDSFIESFLRTSLWKFGFHITLDD